MQCASCHFENMPGSDVCGRCGTSMSLATATIDVHPPRAGRFTKRLRRVVPMRPARNRAAEALRAATRIPLLGFQDTGAFEPLLFRLPIPGWSQIHAGQRGRGQAFLYGWLAMLLPGLLFFGTTLGSILLGLAFSVHSSAAMDIITRYIDNPTLRRRMMYSIGFSALLACVLYLPVGRLITYFADPINIQLAAGPFKGGEVLLVNHAAYIRAEPHPGQLVLFDIGEHQIGGGHQYTVYTGARMDRILAGPGDFVRWQHGQLLVNGHQSRLKPLSPGKLPESLTAIVPESCYLAFPTMTPYLGPNSDVSTWLELSMVPREKIQGRVYFQKHPLRHMKVLD